MVVKDLGKLAQKFSRNAANAAGDYKDGVASAGGSWEGRTAEAEANYVQGVQASIGRGAFAKGVRGAGARYVDKATKLGATRYAPGVQAAEADWQRGFAPVAQVLSGLALPPKGPRRSPQNQARANAVATALGNWKEGK